MVGLGQKGRVPELTTERRHPRFVSDTTRSRLNAILDGLGFVDDPAGTGHAGRSAVADGVSRSAAE